MKLRKFLTRESTGTVIGVLIVSWFAFESIVLAGEEVLNVGFHELGIPMTFDVPVAGETYGITIDRDGRRFPHRPNPQKKRLRWEIIDPTGRVVLADNDPYRRSTRLVQFTPQSAGTHTIIVNWENSGFFKRHDVGHIPLLVNRNDRSLLLRWFPWVW